MIEITENCPCCGEELRIVKWHDDWGLVEVKKTCSCGYVYHWAYGSVISDSNEPKQ